MCGLALPSDPRIAAHSVRLACAASVCPLAQAKTRAGAGCRLLQQQIHRSAVPARRRKWLPRFVSSLRPKLPTLLDKSWWSMEATSFRKTRAVEANVLSCRSGTVLGDGLGCPKPVPLGPASAATTGGRLQTALSNAQNTLPDFTAQSERAPAKTPTLIRPAFDKWATS